MAKTDAELVQSTIRGDRRAFGILVQRHQEAVFSLISRLIRRQSDVEDLAQESFIRAYRALGAFRGDAQFGTWLYRIVWNTCLDHREQQARRQEHEMPMVTENDEEDRMSDMPDSNAPLPDEVLEAGDLRERLAMHLDRLPMHFRAALTLYYFEQRSYEEVAEILDVPMNTVKVHIHRAKAQLKKVLLAEGSPEDWNR